MLSILKRIGDSIIAAIVFIFMLPVRLLQFCWRLIAG